MDILEGWIPAGNSGGGSGKRSSEKGSGGGVVANAAKVETSRGAMRVRVRYNAHLPGLSLWDGENSLTLLVGTVITNMQ